jgi:hypothetical protein
MATWSAIRYNQPCKELYQRLKAAGKAAKLALMAAAVELGLISCFLKHLP